MFRFTALPGLTSLLFLLGGSILVLTDAQVRAEAPAPAHQPAAHTAYDSKVQALSLNNSATKFMSQNSYVAAEPLLQKACQLYPACAGIQSNYGFTLIKLGKCQDGLAHCQKAVELDKDNAIFWNSLALAYEATGQQELAAKAFDQSLKINATAAYVEENYGSMLNIMRRYEEARTHLLKALQLDKTRSNSWKILAGSYVATKDAKAATDAYEQYLKCKPGAPASQQIKDWIEILKAGRPLFFNANPVNKAASDLFHKAADLERRGDYFSAEPLLLKVLELEPDYAPAQYDLGLALQKSGKNSDALAYLIRATELDKGNAKYWDDVGVAYTALSNFPSALKACQAAEALDPNDASIQYSYGLALEKSGNFKDALTHLLKAVDLKNDNSNYLSAAAHAYSKLGAYDQAKPMLSKAIALSKDQSVQAWLLLGHIGIATGDFKAAENAYRQYLNVAASDAKTARIRAAECLSRLESVVPSKASDYLKEDKSSSAMRWAPGSMPLKVFLESGEGIPSFEPQYQDLLKEAFAAWANASDGAVSFAFVPDKDSADITTRWTADLSCLKHITEGGETNERKWGDFLRHADIIILTTEPTAAENKLHNLPTSKLSDNYVRLVSMHEVGHSIGLRHSGSSADVMYPFANNDTQVKEPQLSERDKTSLKRLYESHQ